MRVPLPWRRARLLLARSTPREVVPQVVAMALPLTLLPLEGATRRG